MKDDLIIASKLLGDFNNFLARRSITFLTRLDSMLDNILVWHFKAWNKEHEYLGKEDKLEIWSIYSDLSRTLDSIFQQIEARTLKERATFPLFNRLKKHTAKYKKESVAYHNYADFLFAAFYHIFFQHIYDAPERFDIWNHYFPKEWKVTKNNLQDPENVISIISLNNFYEWAINRIWQTSKELDFPLNDVSSNLFPEVDPILWAKVLIFIFSPYGEDRLRSVIERPWNFGFIGRVRVFDASKEEVIGKMSEADETSTFELSYFLFREEFSVMKLESYIESLNKLSYVEESEEERKRSILLRLFTKLLDFVRNREKAKPNHSDEGSS